MVLMDIETYSRREENLALAQRLASVELARISGTTDTSSLTAATGLYIKLLRVPFLLKISRIAVRMMKEIYCDSVKK